MLDGWGARMLGAVSCVAGLLAVGLGLPPRSIVEAMRNGPHLLAPTGSDLAAHGGLGTVFAGFHYDLNLMTIHGRSRFPGLYVWLRDGRRVPVRVPAGCLLLQAGKQLEWLTGGHVLAGMHEVRARVRDGLPGGGGERCGVLGGRLHHRVLVGSTPGQTHGVRTRTGPCDVACWLPSKVPCQVPTMHTTSSPGGQVLANCPLYPPTPSNTPRSPPSRNPSFPGSGSLCAQLTLPLLSLNHTPQPPHPMPPPPPAGQVVVSPETQAAVAAARAAGRSLWRVSSTVFAHVASDYLLQPLGRFAAEGEGEQQQQGQQGRYEEASAQEGYPPILAGEQVQRELEAICLRRRGSSSPEGAAAAAAAGGGAEAGLCSGNGCSEGGGGGGGLGGGAGPAVCGWRQGEAAGGPRLMAEPLST